MRITLALIATAGIALATTIAGTQISTAQSSVPAKITGLTATAGNFRVYISWNNPNDPSITRYDAKIKLTSQTWNDVTWQELNNVDFASYKAYILATNGEEWGVRIRAVNPNGNGPESDAASTTPSASITNPANTPTATNTPDPTDTPTRSEQQKRTNIIRTEATAEAAWATAQAALATAEAAWAAKATAWAAWTITSPELTDNTNTPAPTDTPTATNTPDIIATAIAAVRATAQAAAETDTPTATADPSVRPNKPINLQVAVNSDGTSATVSWESGGSGVGGNCPTTRYHVTLLDNPSYNVVSTARVSDPTTTHTVTLTADQNYNVQVNAYGSSCDGYSELPATLYFTATASTTFTPAATPTATNTPDPAASDTPTPTATNTPAPTDTPTATNTPDPSATPTNTPDPTDTPTVTNTPDPSASPTDTPAPTATATHTPDPSASATPTATPSLRPNTPANVRVVVKPGGTEATVTWDPGVGGTCPDVRYDIRQIKGGVSTYLGVVYADAESLSKELTGLTRGERYRITISAYGGSACGNAFSALAISDFDAIGPTATPTPTATATFTATATPTITNTPTATNTPSPTATYTPRPTNRATAIAAAWATESAAWKDLYSQIWPSDDYFKAQKALATAIAAVATAEALPTPENN